MQVHHISTVSLTVTFEDLNLRFGMLSFWPAGGVYMGAIGGGGVNMEVAIGRTQPRRGCSSKCIDQKCI